MTLDVPLPAEVGGGVEDDLLDSFGLPFELSSDREEGGQLSRHYAILRRSEPTVDEAFADTHGALGASVMCVHDFA